jgi:hypothetical protein
MKVIKKNLKRVITWNNKHIAREVARSCQMPYEEALKLVQVIINMWQVKLRSERRLLFRDFGIITVSKLIKFPDGRKPYIRFRFIMSESLNNYLGNKVGYDFYDYEIRLARKIRRLFLAGDKSWKRHHKRLKLRLESRPATKAFLIRLKVWPIEV